MNGSLGPFNLVLLAIPGVALLLCVRLLYGRKASAAPDSALLLLRIGGRVMLVAAVAGLELGCLWPNLVMTIGLTLAGIVVLLTILDRRMRLEHQALLSSIAVAAEKGIPLPEAVLAFADEFNSSGARRALWLVQALRQGVPLDQALSYAWIKCSTSARMAVRIGCSLGCLGSSLRNQAESAEELESLVRPMFTRWIYLFGLVLSAEVVVSFLMLWIVPVFDKMFQEFGIKLPVMTILLINLTRWTVNYGWLLLLPLTMVASLACLAGVFSYIGWLPRNAPLVNRMFRRYDGAIVLRSLAIAIRRGQPLHGSLRLMANIYPLGIVRKWLSKASAAVEGGQDWCDALRKVRLIDQTDAVVLRAAQAAGNLPWALDEMAESLLRREIYRWQAWYNIISPAAVLLMGGCIGFICIAMFLPLVEMIKSLA